MFKQYKIAITGVSVLILAVIATTVLSLKNEKPKGKDTDAVEAFPFAILDGGIMESYELPTEKSAIITISRNNLQMVTVAKNILEPTADYEETDIDEISPVDETPQSPVDETETAEEEESPFANVVLPKVDVYLNIRENASTDAEIIGKLYVGSSAQIISQEGDWTKIQSGSVEGYVSNEFIVTGYDAEELAKEQGKVTAIAAEGGLRVRKEPSTESDVYNIVGEGQTFDVLEELDGWVGIDYSADTIAYLSADYVKLDYGLGEAISIEEEREQIRLAEEAAAKAAAEEAALLEAERQRTAQVASASSSVEVTVRDGMAVTYDDTYLLACLVHMEAGGEPYEGKLAVANVVLNRLRSGYGSTIAEVIYARGQFSGANTGALASRLAKGPSDECLRAATEALNGINNIGDYRNFITTARANYGIYSEYTIIGNHCFYKR